MRPPGRLKDTSIWRLFAECIHVPCPFFLLLLSCCCCRWWPRRCWLPTVLARGRAGRRWWTACCRPLGPT